MRKKRSYERLVDSSLKGFFVTCMANIIFPLVRNMTDGIFSSLVLFAWVAANVFIVTMFRKNRLNYMYFVFGLIAPVILVVIIVGAIPYLSR